MSIIHELLDVKALEKIVKLVDEPINQPEKADKYVKILKPYGFRQFDMGTNRQVFTHKDYPKLVFKIALDEQGVIDNGNEKMKSDHSKYFPETHDIDADCVIMAQRKRPTISLEEFRKNKTQKRIRKILTELDQEGFVLMDLGSDKHKNFGTDKDGNIYIIDFGYVEWKAKANFNCPTTRHTKPRDPKYCKGTLQYNESFTRVFCSKCKNEFKVDVVLNGYTSTMYSDSNIPKGFKVTPELEEFFVNFTNSRDRSALKKYVELSNTSNGGTKSVTKGDKPMTSRERLLNRMKGGTFKMDNSEPIKPRNHHEKQESHCVPDPQEVYDQMMNLSQPEAEEEVVRTINQHGQLVNREVTETPIGRPINVFHSTPEGVDVLKTNEEIEDAIYTADVEVHLSPETQHLAEDLVAENEFADAAEVLRHAGADDETADEIVRELFFSRFPEMRSLADQIQACGDEQAATSSIDLLDVAGISAIQPDQSDEIHLEFDVDKVKLNPWIIMSKAGTVIHIDLVQHMERLQQIVGDEDEDHIVTFMEVEPLSDFGHSSEYDDSYFDTELDNDDE